MSSIDPNIQEILYILGRNSPEFASLLLAYAIALEKATQQKEN